MPNNVFESQVMLSDGGVRKLADAAIAEATRLGVAVSVAVVDRSLEPLSLTRMSTASHVTASIAVRKAATAMAFGLPTGWMPDTLAGPLVAASGDRVTNLPGGLPVRQDGVTVAAVAVSGATAELDAAIASAAVAALDL